MNGTLIGFETLKDQLSVCPFSYDEIKNMNKFGTVTEKSCDFDLTKLSSGPLPDDANFFFDLFIKDQNGNLIDVPVLITNFVDSTGGSPNTGNDMSSWRLVRRFFMYDTISSASNGAWTYARYASNIKLKVTLDPNSQSSILSPYLVITYSEVKTTSISDGSTGQVSFLADYYQDISAFWRRVTIAFIIIQVLIGVIIAIKLYYFLQQNPRQLLQEKFTFVLLQRLAYLFFDVWAGIMFWLLFFTTAYWFVTFKMASSAFILLPPVDEWPQSYVVFDTIFGLILAFRFVAIVMAIFEQSNIDVFLVDWEPQPQQISTKSLMP